MVLGVGLVSAIIVSKKNPNYKTRLEKLQAKLQKNRLTQMTLYEIPTKRIIIIFIFMFFIFIFNHFEQSLRLQLLQAKNSTNTLVSPSVNLDNIKNQTQSSNFEIYQVNDEVEHLSSVLMWIKIAYLFMVIGVVADLRWKIVKIVPEYIEIRQYDRDKLGKLTKIKWTKQNNKIQIVSQGQQKLTHYTSHFILKIINSSSKQTHQIIKRSHIFQARKTIIQLGSILQFQPDLTIH